jgi:hypothetical protein
MPLPAIVIGFGAYSFAAILSGLYVLGKEKSETSGKTLGIYASLAFLAMFFNSIANIIYAPLGIEYPASSIQLLFSLLLLLFSSVWLGFSICLFYNWDLKFVGDDALVLFLFHLIGFLLIFQWFDVFGLPGFIILQINNVLYLLVEFGFWALTHGKIPATVQGALLLLSGFANFAIVLYSGGIII